MIDFRSYLAELFDRTFELTDNYTFLVQEKGGRLLPVPNGGAALDAWVEENFNGTTPNVYRYVVTFTEIWLIEGYEEFKLFYGFEHRDMEGVYELGFERRLVELDRLIRPRPVGSDPKKFSRYYWRSMDLGTDEDLNWLGAGEASAIFGTVVEAAKRFVKQNRPRGIVIGTKAEANPARGRIYKALARRAAAAANGTVYDLALARGDMAAPAIVWFRKGKNPFKDMQ